MDYKRQYDAAQAKLAPIARARRAMIEANGKADGKTERAYWAAKTDLENLEAAAPARIKITRGWGLGGQTV
jgi:hypothetical protein